MRWLPFVAVLASGAALADDADDADDATPGPPVPFVVQGRLAGTSAKLAARFTIDVPAMGVFDRHAMLEMPEHAVVTGGRITVDGVAHVLSLVDAERAGKLWDAVTARAPGSDRAWQVRVTGEPNEPIVVDITAPHAGRVELALELELPTCYYRDARYAAIPESWQPALDRALSRLPMPPSEELAAACESSAAAFIAFSAHELAERPAGEARIGAIGDRLPLASTHVARVELDIARELGEVPRDLHTVLLVDASRSMRDAERGTQRAIVESYLRAAHGTDVQVIAYARKAWPLLAGWTSTYETTGIAGELAALPVRNGSNLDAGLAEAGTWLAKTTGTRRVIVFTDELVRDALSERPAAELARLLPPGTLVHVVAVDSTAGAGIDRDDVREFAPLAAATFGLSTIAHGGEDADLDATMLVRPISLDALEITAPGWTTVEVLSGQCEGQLAEGGTCTWLGKGAAAAGAITVHGKIWGRDFVRTITADPARARTLARELASRISDLKLSTDQSEELWRVARVVSDMFALYASWGHDGYSDLELGGWGCGCGSGHSSTFGHGFGIRGNGSGQRPEPDLHAQLQHALEACHTGTAHVRFDLELTRDEIVDVGVTTDRTTAHDCLVEAAWSTMLALRDAPAHQHVMVSFGS